MGLFDKFRKNDKNEQKEEIPQDTYSMSYGKKDDAVSVFGISNYSKVKHRNNELTNLIMARISKYHKGNAIYLDIADYIAFELPEGQQINQQIMQSVMEHYLAESYNQETNQNIYYIGRLQQNRDNYIFGNKSDAVNRTVKEMAEKQILVRQEQLKMQAIEKQKQLESERFRESLNVNDYMNEMQQIFNERKANPTLVEIGPYSKYKDYNGVDINTGEILRIRGTEKIGKDGSGTYLYTAFLNKTPNEDDVEFLEAAGYPVCFELYRRLEDIVQSGNKEEIIKVLQLLSDERNFEEMDRLTYIGEVDRYGQVNRQEESRSTAIATRIKAMQQEFARRHGKQQDEWQQ